MAETERAGPASLPIRLTFLFGIADRPEGTVAKLENSSII